MALINTTGKNPKGEQVQLPVSGQPFAPILTPVGANQSPAIPIIDHRGYSGLLYVVRSDVASANGGITIEFSDDGIVWYPAGIGITYSQVGVQVQRALVPKGSFSRFSYVNGPVAQTTFRFEVLLTTANVQPTLSSLNLAATDTVLASISKSIVELPDGVGSYGFVQRTGSAMNVNITNPSSATDVSALAKETTLGTAVTALNAINTDLGAPNDTQATTSSATNGVIALLKGILQRPSTGTTTTVTTTGTSVQILAANPNRKGATIFSVTGTILISLGSQNSATLFSSRIITNGYYEVPFGYTGAIFANGAGTVTITELV